MKTRIAIAFCAILAFAAIAWAHGDEVHVLGTVAKVEGSTITVTGQDGNQTTVNVTAETKFLKGSAAAKLEDVKPGERVVIHAKKVKDQLQATEVRIGSASKATTS